MCSCQYFHFQYRTAGFHIYNSLLWQRKTWVSWSSLYFSLDQSPLYKQSFTATAISSSVKILTLPHLVSDILYCKHWSTWIPFSTIGVWLASQIAELVKKKNNNLPAVQETWFDSWVRKIPWWRDRLTIPVFLVFPGGSDGKESACNAGDLGWKDPLEEGMAIHSSILAWRIPMGRRAWWAAVRGVAKSQTQLSN